LIANVARHRSISKQQSFWFSGRDRQHLDATTRDIAAAEYMQSVSSCSRLLVPLTPANPGQTVLLLKWLCLYPITQSFSCSFLKALRVRSSL
jgi:hypothetical protein